ncbi:MAG TPA: hypothetical protein VKR59_06295 [Terriglobales bacterium]|nr:hypothetical protein [Terriglobales bacterium]
MGLKVHPFYWIVDDKSDSVSHGSASPFSAVSGRRPLSLMKMYDRSKVEEVVSAVRAVTTEHAVQVSAHFAGYFDELGITVALKTDTSDSQVQRLKDKVLTALSQVAMPFQWLVIFQRDGKGAGTLFPDGLFTGDSE